MQVLQNKLEEKQNECDEMLGAMQKTRSEAIRRLDQQRQESEAKIATLLSQLRVAESARMETSASLRRSEDLSAVLRASRGSGIGIGIGSGSGSGSVVAEAGGLGSLAAALRKSDAELGAYVQRVQQQAGGGGDDSEGGAFASSDWAFQREILKRWQSERERREVLEKRNLELTRELRHLKTQR